jgi:hypothetical protein
VTRDVFKMPVPMKITGRSSTITNSFVNSIIPVVHPSDEDITKALSLLEMNHETIECCYCGDSYSEWDHLRPLVKNKMPTGYISEIQNLIPSCGKCNQSKGNKDWWIWIISDAPKSPKARGVSDLEARINRIKDYMEWRKPTLVDFEMVVGADLWNEHWSNCQKVQNLLVESQKISDRIKNCFFNDAIDDERFIESSGNLLPTMRISELVRVYIPKIMKLIESNHDGILVNLQDIEYSKRVFGIQYPFLLETLPEQAREPRYWGKLYQVNLSYFRITSEWHEDRSREKFLKFIKEQGIDFVH